MEIRKRSGESVPFQQEKIFNAMKKAFDGQGREIGSRELDEILAAVLDNLAAAAPLTVERVQDEVERTLMERGHYEVAKAYILYREKRSALRRVRHTIAQTVGDDSLDEVLRRIQMDFTEEVYSLAALQMKFESFCRPGMTEDERAEALTKAAVELTTAEAPKWEFIAARLLNHSFRCRNAQEWEERGIGDLYGRLRYLTDKGLYRDLASGYAMMCRMPYTLFTVVLNAMFLLLMPLGMLLVGGADGWAVLADLVFYIFFAPQLAFMMERLMYAVNAQMEAAEAVNKLEAILRESPLPEPAADSVSRPADSGISFENVTFSYDGADRPALTNVSFRLPQGEAWALVGPSGGGKTTIARLIPRFFDVQEGAVLLGGRDVRSIPTAELMEQISFVFQEVRLFKKSIRDNIRAARPDATEAEILHAAQLAQCGDILEKTPGGLDAVIGAKGVYLSGGEMQRIALARAILKDAPIVVLDEASSFADPENEAKIQKAFEALMKGKTVLMIAHRLSTVRNMDRILVIRDGGIAEEGKHDELLEKGGVYAAMWEEYQKAAQWKVGGAA